MKTIFTLPLILMLSAPSWSEDFYSAQPIVNFTPQQELILTGLIYFEKHDLPTHAMAYFSQAANSEKNFKKPSPTTCWAHVHLARMESLKGLKLIATKDLEDTLNSCNFPESQKPEEKQFQQLATQTYIDVVEDLEGPGFIEAWLQKFPDLKISDRFHLLKAKYSVNHGDLQTGLKETEVIRDSTLKPQADLIQAMILYRMGKLAESLDLLNQNREARLLALAPDLRSEAQMLTARLRFQKGDYDGAFQSYSSVPKGNPIWMQAMIEQAWAQILHKDFEGAAGNMYSLHTDFFKNAFAPESYIVRAVGYLNLCQFGDSVRTLYDLNRKYQGLRIAFERFNDSHTKTSDYYGLVKEFLLNSDLHSIQGLPKFAVYDLAKNRKFISLQTRINNLQDEMEKFSALSEELISWEKKTHSKKVAALRSTLKDLRLLSANRIKSEQLRLQELAAIALKERFTEMVADIKKSVEQSELLRFEILSAAGENMRFELAGGQITDQEKSFLELPKDQSFHWNFNGEVWEDELGHYRSNLKNVCANNETQNAQKKETQHD